MKNKLPNALIIIFSAILASVIGIATGFVLCVWIENDIPWDHHTLPVPPKGTMSISHIEYHSFLADPTGDIIFIETKDGEIYSNTLFENDWLLVEDASTAEGSHKTNCAPTWAGAQSNAPIWDPPPTGNNVHDSVGARFEHAFAIDVRCYVLLDDGTLEVWARESTAASIFAFVFFYGPVFGIVGLIIGIFIGVFLVRKRKKKASQSTQDQTD